MSARRIGRPLLIGLALVALVMLGGSVAAGQGTDGAAAGQAPAAADVTYALTWWTANAGGASYRTAGSYALGGTAGQPDAAPERTGSNGSAVYTLRAGFWQPSCIATAAAPTITRAGSTVTLAWVHNEGDPTQAYQVHRATTPYFTATDATRRTIVTGAPWSYIDPDPVIGDPNTNYFYLVRATCGAAYGDPGRRGEFDFRLTPGSP